MRLLPLLFVVSWLSACGSQGGSDGGGHDACEGAVKDPPNLLADPGFDCGTSGWQSVYGTYELVDGRSGKAGKLTFTGGAGATFASLTLDSPVARATYCMSAWVKGDAPTVSGELRDSQAQGQAFTTYLSSEWQRLPPSINVDYVLPVDRTLQVVFRIPTTGPNAAASGQSVIVDDVDVWVSASGRCDETR